MSIALNPVYIDQFPETNMMLSSDQIIAFRKTDSGEYTPIVFTAEELTAFFVAHSILDTLEQTMKNLISTATEVETNLKKTLPTKNDFNDYSTITKFDQATNSIEQKSNFTNVRLANKADQEFLNAQYNSFLARIQHFKSQLASGIKSQGWNDDGRPAKEILATLAMGVARGLEL